MGFDSEVAQLVVHSVNRRSLFCLFFKYFLQIILHTSKIFARIPCQNIRFFQQFYPFLTELVPPDSAGDGRVWLHPQGVGSRVVLVPEGDLTSHKPEELSVCSLW